MDYSVKLQIKSKAVSIHGKTDVLDEAGTVVYRTHTKAVTVHDKTYLEDADGNEVAYIHAKAVSIHNVHYIDMASGESLELKEELKHIRDFVDIEPIGWQLRGDGILDFNFQIYDENGTVVATAHRKFASLHGIYDMEVLDESRMDVIVAIFIVIKRIVEIRGENTGGGYERLRSAQLVGEEVPDLSLSASKERVGACGRERKRICIAGVLAERRDPRNEMLQ